jgi:hypothetical protein
MIGNAPEETNGRLTMRQDQIMKILVELVDSGYRPRPSASGNDSMAQIPGGEPPHKRRQRDLKLRVENPS